MESKSVMEAVLSRRSIRTFDGRPVEREKLNECLEAARWAPSWANKQCWRFVMVTGGDEVNRLGIVPSGIKNPPALLVACADPKMSGNREGKQYYLVDVAIAVEHYVLAAWEQGLGTCWVGWFTEEKVKKALGIPDNIRVVAMIPTGYPAEKEAMMNRVARRLIKSADRKEIGEFVHFQKW
jgi:nitroreductase